MICLQGSTVALPPSSRNEPNSPLEEERLLLNEQSDDKAGEKPDMKFGNAFPYDHIYP